MAKTVIGHQQQQDEEYNWKDPEAIRMSDTKSRQEQETEYIMLAQAITSTKQREKQKPSWSTIETTPALGRLESRQLLI